MGFFNLFKSNRKLKKDFKVETSSNASDNDSNHTIDEDFKKTLFLYSLSFYPNPIKENDDYKRYLIYTYKINNPKTYHKQLIDENYFEPIPTNEAISYLKLNDLKAICEKHKLNTGGKKEELINRILNSLSIDDLNEISSINSWFQISKKGRDFINKHYEYILIHNHSKWNISINEYEQAKKEITFKSSFYDIVWRIFNKRLLQNNLYNSINTYYNMYELLYEEKKYKNALYFLLLVIYLDLSGIENQKLVELGINPIYDESFHKGMKKRVKDEDGHYKIVEVDEANAFDGFTLSSSLVNELISLKDFYNEKIIDDIYNNHKLPFCCCSKDLFKNIIKEIFEDRSFNEKYYRPILIENLKKHLR